MPLPAVLPLLAKAGAAAAGMFTAQNVGSMVGMTAVPLIIEHMMSGPPSPENIAKIKSIIDSESMKLSQTQNIPLADAQRQMKAELEPALMEAMSSKPGAMGTLAAWVGGGIAGGHIGGKIGAKFAKAPAGMGRPGMDAGDASPASAPAAIPPSPTVPVPAAAAPAPEFGRAGMTSADDMLKYAGGAPPTPIVKPGGKSVLAKRKPAMPATTPVPADDLLKSAQAPAADPLAAAASSAAADLRAAKPLVRPTGPVAAIPVSGPELGKAAKYLRDKGHLKPGDEAAFAADAASVTDGPGLRALVEKWSKPRAGGTAEEAIKARMMGFKSSKGI